jgi:hypothetical protein
MARPKVMTYQQRYKMVPVLDDDGKQKKVPVMDARTGAQKTNKRGVPTWRSLTVADKSQPKPIHKCERCNTSLVVGEKYRVVAIKTQSGGYDRFRCMACPVWLPWELSNSLSARISQIQSEDIDVSGAEDESSAQDCAAPLAEMIRELAEEKRESASNIEDGFGHSTFMSDELNETADNLDSWADELENLSFEDTPATDCPDCDGDGTEDCQECDGNGEITDEAGDSQECENCACDDGKVDCSTCQNSGEREVPQEEMEEWRESVRQTIQDALDNAPM